MNIGTKILENFCMLICEVVEITLWSLGVTICIHILIIHFSRQPYDAEKCYPFHCPQSFRALSLKSLCLSMISTAAFLINVTTNQGARAQAYCFHTISLCEDNLKHCFGSEASSNLRVGVWALVCVPYCKTFTPTIRFFDIDQVHDAEESRYG